MERCSQLRGLIISLLFMISCGVKGPLQPPLVLVPKPVERLLVSQQGTTIKLSWETPLVYQNGVAMSSWPVVEVWGVLSPLGGEAERPLAFDSKEFQKKRQLMAEVSVEGKEPGISLPPSLNQSWSYSFKTTELESFVFTGCLRVRDSSGRKSAFSEPITVIPVPTPNPPRNLRFTLKEDGVELRWEPGDEALLKGEKPVSQGFYVYRKEGNSGWLRLTEYPIQDPGYEDKTAIMKRVYLYQVTAIRTVDSILRESEGSAPVEVAFRDVFPPPPPSGVVIVVSETAVVLSWEPNPAADLAGYRVWRKSEDENSYRLLTPEPILQTSYEDRQVAKGKSYRYAITAVDQEGNESRQTEIETEVIRGPWR